MTDEFTKDIMRWGVKSWSAALAFWDNNVDWDSVQNGLELGGREGGLSLWLALKGKATVCSDLKNVRVAAEPLHLKYGVDHLITYEDVDATNIPYEDHFDVIVFKSIIGAVGRDDNYPAQQAAFNQIYKALKPGGKLLFAENLTASPAHQRLRRHFSNWGGSNWRYVSVAEMDEFLKNFRSYDMRTTGVLAALGRTERQRDVLATIDQRVLNRVCPDGWKYIAYGIAEK